MMREAIRGLVLAAAMAGSLSGAEALTPLPRPEAFPDIEPGTSAPFAASWSITIPTMDVETPDTQLATCKAPVVIEAANAAAIFYLGRHGSRDDADAAMTLRKLNGGTMWEPVAGGPSFFAFWVNRDVFYLYDDVPQTDGDWGVPYIYRRC